jgi:hypothetical protein
MVEQRETELEPRAIREWPTVVRARLRRRWRGVATAAAACASEVSGNEASAAQRGCRRDAAAAGPTGAPPGGHGLSAGARRAWASTRVRARAGPASASGPKVRRAAQ